MTPPSGDSAQNGNVILLHFSSDDIWEKRLYLGADFRVEDTTSEVLWGYYAIFVVGSSATLHGTYGGVGGIIVPNRTLTEFAEFSVDVTGVCSDRTTNTTNLHFDYRYVEPEQFAQFWIPNTSQMVI